MTETATPIDPDAGRPRVFPEALANASGVAQLAITARLAGAGSPVADAMRYAIEGGKGLRAFLVIEGARLHGFDQIAAAAAAGAIEALHAYSLIHDDMPCMDDDGLRRGKPTVHRKWDEATAVLAGDALQALAFEMLYDVGCPAGQRLRLNHDLAVAAGIGGMVGGQEADMRAETAETDLSLDDIIALQAGKTGALITWSANAGAVMAGSDGRVAGLGELKAYGDALGLAFQIWDDVLDVEGDATEMGKAVGKDAGRGKATFVSHLGLDGAKRRAESLVSDACDALSVYGSDADCLRDAARFVISRRS